MERYLAHFRRAGKRPTIIFTHHAAPSPVWTPALDMYETAEAIVVLFDVAGVQAEQTEVHAEPHTLTIRGVRRERYGTDRADEQRNCPRICRSCQAETLCCIQGCSCRYRRPTSVGSVC